MNAHARAHAHVVLKSEYMSEHHTDQDPQSKHNADALGKLCAQVIVRCAQRSDCGQIHALIQELAEYEHCPRHVLITPETLALDGFDSPTPQFKCVVADAVETGTLAGFALFYPCYSTWQGRCIFLEDLYVQPQHRGKGIGRRLISRVARHTVDSGGRRLCFNVLAWNEPAKKFYDHIGASNLSEKEQWQVFRVDGHNLHKLADRDQN